ncbi:hypothetical protein LTR28_009896 [Elasticomyces elasticus]|nr:hypothetical protein LTR28_009896 [Elasticomyces elasticus]
MSLESALAEEAREIARSFENEPKSARARRNSLAASTSKNRNARSVSPLEPLDGESAYEFGNYATAQPTKRKKSSLYNPSAIPTAGGIQAGARSAKKSTKDTVGMMGSGGGARYARERLAGLRSSSADVRRKSEGNALPTRTRKLSDGDKFKTSAPDGAARLVKDYDREGSESSGSDDEYEGDTDASTDAESKSARSKRRGRRERRDDSPSAVPRDELEKARANPDQTSPHDPTITVTPPRGSDPPLSPGSSPTRSNTVQPHTAFDTRPRSPNPESELANEIRRAQKLALSISPIHSTPEAHRSLRQIVRGDYAHFQREAERGKRRQRMYLVATDMSDEAEYALEWTIGTVLRDGDTLLAVYAVDEEGKEGGSEGVEIGHGADVVRDTARIVGTLGEEKREMSLVRNLSTDRGRRGSSVGSSPLVKSAGPDAISMGLNERGRSSSRTPVQDPNPVKAESKEERDSREAREREQLAAMEPSERARYIFTKEVSARCIRLLRKTKLQVRVVVEVFHCKSPRHMITEVIDFLSPTLVILGSRGRSAIKGVLLGSFSNYLVAKSSVPVMVARKRLRKHSKHNKRQHTDGLPVAAGGDGRPSIVRLSNMLEAPGRTRRKSRGLAGAVID